ncbi:hypothetical protein WI73_02100 [Burkholderia ubonensis]|uniref:hypothetical protein n=1 Tax=Burkholderia ubonensis TaxID=101571 RepID=UPI000757639B|nr:hypothetical protein [Burkholderia ubonensis]KUZ67600.1 hypothetical protein WI36_22940 [Burkholderia ubonensis]KVA16984.1 hypothetical protein WI43_21230 [Burkholderia ubonensis]KVA17412.1 hypothetical protein WI42_00405 [Burkholderia ubonensis]KVA34530.1 hypothetical protein WI46_23870 [Burkholderia ubonensis]KVC53570.1 hypothetical protein WI72_20875 [Burkholderia ubonensis]
MKVRSRGLLAAAALAAGAFSGAVVAVAPRALPALQDIWISGTIQRGNGEFAPGDYTTIRLDRPAASPCSDKVVTDILLGRADTTEHLLLLPYLNQRVAVKGRITCPDSGIQFAPTPDFVFPIY